MHQHASLPVGGHGAEGRQRPPRPAAGRRADGLRAVDQAPEVPSGRSALAGPRPLRALCRPRLGPALQPAARHRLRPVAGRHQAVPPVGQQGAGASRIRPHAGRGSHHRAARPGPGQCGGHGHRRGAAGGHLQPRRPPRDRPPHLGHRQRRRPDGRRGLRGRLAGRASQARQAGVPVRRQLRHPGRRHRHHLFRGSRQTLRGVRLADDQGGRRQRHRRDRPGLERCGVGNRAADPDPGAHPSRLRLAQAGQLQGARLAAGQGRRQGDQGESGLADQTRLSGAGAGAQAFPRSRAARRAGPVRVEQPSGRLCESLSRAGRRAARAPARRIAGRLGCRHPELRRRPQGPGHARGRRQGDERDRAASAGIVRRLGRPRLLHFHQLEGLRRLQSRGHQGPRHAGFGQRRLEQRRPQPALRRTRACDGRDRQRPGRARRLHPVRLDLPDLLRLHAPGDPAGRADGRARDPRVHPRQHRTG